MRHRCIAIFAILHDLNLQRTPEMWLLKGVFLLSLILMPCLISGCEHQRAAGVADPGAIHDKQLTASSSPPATGRFLDSHHGRVNGSYAWCPRTKTERAWLQVDLGRAYNVCAVATQGRDWGPKYYTTSYTLSLSIDGSHWSPYKEINRTKVFSGNADSISIKVNRLPAPPHARFVRFYPQSFYGWPCLRVEVYVEAVLPRITTNQKPAIALGFGDTLNLTCFASGEPPLQIRWLKDGRSNNTRANISQNHALLSILHVKPGDSGKYDCIAKNAAGVARHSITVTVFPCSNIAEIGVANHSRVDHSRMKASSEFGKVVDYLTVKHGRLHGKKGWCPVTKDGNDWLEVDLGAMYHVCGVATQGKEHRTDEWTTRFKLAFSADNTSRKVYRENDREKEFKGNVDKSSVVINPLPIMHLARFVRFYPTASYLWPCLRAEIFVEIASPTLLQRPQNQTVEQGGSVTLSCKASGSPMPTVTWSFNNGNVTSGRILENGSLAISRVINSGAYEGQYTCHASSQAGSARSSAYVRVIVLPRISTPLKTAMSLASGDSLHLTCEASGDPPPQIKWLKNGSTDIERANITENNNVLSISHVEPGDSGDYDCVARNTAGVAKTRSTVTVFRCYNITEIGVANHSRVDHSRMKASSEFGKVVDYLTVKHGRLHGEKAWCPATKDGNDWLEIDLGTVYHVCGVATQGKEHRTDEWTTRFKLAFSADNTSRKVYRANDPDKEFKANIDQSSVVINPLPIMQRARFVRFYPTASHLWPCLRVEIFVEIASPTLLQRPRNQTVVQGGSVTLPCQASGSPMPTVAWLFNNGNVTKGRVFSNGSLAISRVMNSGAYEGRYTCHAISNAGSARSSAYVRVLEKPQIIDRPPSHQTYYRGSTLFITCKTRGDPPPTVTWTWNSHVDIPHVQYRDKGATLVIDALGASQVGVYQCVVHNIVGKDNASITVDVFDCNKTRSVGVDNSSIISDSGITSSSVYGVSKGTVKYGRLNSQRAWCPEKQAGHDWLQIDLGGYYFICGVATQGNEHGKNEWTSQYKVGLSGDGIKWKIYMENEQEKLFVGNRDWGTVVRNPLRSQAFWRFVRFYPVVSHKWPCMRVDVFVEIAVPYLVVKPSSQAVEQGRNVRLDCQAAGVPLSSLSWRFKAKPVTSGVVMANGSLMLTSVKNTADYEGSYVCETGLGDSKTKASAEIIIYEKPKMINNFRSVETFVVGKTGVLACHTVGDPTPDVTWLKDGAPIGSYRRYTYHENKALLVVTPVKSRDDGTFTCVSENKYGELKASANVTVIDRPTIAKDKTRPLIKTVLGIPTNVACFVKSGLPVTFNWTRSGKYLTSTDSIKVYENVLVVTVTRSEDFGVFTCVASNAAGTTTYNITVALAEHGLVTTGKVEANQAQGSGTSERASIIAPLVLFIVASVVLNVYLLYRLRRRRVKREQSEIQMNLISSQQEETSDVL